MASGGARARYISCCVCKVTDAGLKELASLKELKVIQLRQTKITNQGINDLRKTRPEISISR
jgi:hypothetical protein